MTSPSIRATGMTAVEVDFSKYTGSGRRIAFKNILRNSATYDYSYNYIDDIKLSSVTEPCGISALPYTEDFEGHTSATETETGVEPGCWEVVDTIVSLGSSTKPQLYHAYATSGSYTLRLMRCRS